MGSGASTAGGVPRSRSSSRSVSSAEGIHHRRTSRASSDGSDQINKHAPPPFPPKMQKDQIYDPSKYMDVDKHAMHIPKSVLRGTFSDLLDAVIQGPWTEMAKLRAIFRWLTSIDAYNLVINETPPTYSPLEYFRKIQENKGNHAHLLSGLCQMAGIPCVIISGMNKSAAYQVGKPLDRKSMGAQWNAVYVEGEWRLIDSFWACSCVVGKRSGEWTLMDEDGQVVEASEEEDEGFTQHRINEFYFLTDPEKLIWTHFPDDPNWQLLKRPISKAEFEEHFYVRERFYHLDMGTTQESQMKCILTTKKGQADIQFCLPQVKSKNFRFKYMLYLSRAALKENKANFFLDRFIFFEQRSDLLLLALRFPIKGTFKLDLFGVDTADSDVFDLVCTYLIQCPEPQANCFPLPDVPRLGWGPLYVTSQAGLKPKTHQTGVINTKDGNVEIKFGVDRKVKVHQALLHAVIDQATLNNYSVTRMENGEVIVNVRLPMGGEYALKLYAQEEGEDGEAPNVCNYLIRCDKDTLNNIPFPNVPTGSLGKQHMGDKLGVKALSHPVGCVETKDGRLPMTFEAPENVELMCEIHKVSSDGNVIKMAVQPKVHNGVWSFDVDLPVTGEYSLNIFAKTEGDEDRIYNVHSYLINSKGRKNAELDLEEETTTACNPVPVETVETADNELWIPAPEGYENVVAALHRKNASDPPTIHQISFLKQDDQDFIRVKLPEYGDYVMNLYNSKENGNVENIAKYQINRKPPADLFQTNIQTIMDAVEGGEEDDPEGNTIKAESPVRVPSPMSSVSSKGSSEDNLDDAKKKTAKKQLENAMETKDIGRLRKALAACTEANVGETELLEKANRLLQVLEAKKVLMEASAKRNLKMLDDAISNAKNANFDHMLDLQIAMAKKLRDQLARIEKLRHQVLSMEQKTIAEIKSFSSPPDGVFQTMQAAFLLLGHTKKDVKEWPMVVALMSKTGKESLMRKVSMFEPQTTYLDYARKAKETVAEFSLERIRNVNSGAATFYVWVTGMTEEVESTGGAGMSPSKRK